MTPPPDAPMTTNGTDLDLRALAEKVWNEHSRAESGLLFHQLYDAERACAIALVEAGLRAQAPSLVLTDAAFCAAYRVFYETATGDADILEAEGRLLAFFRALLAERTSQAPSLLEAKRETWDAARDWAGEWWGRNAIPGREKDFDAERDRRFPLPAPAGITLSDRITHYLSSGGLFNPEMANHDAVRDLLIECRDALKAYAAEQEAR